MIYELREYVASEDKVEALHKRFKDSTLPIFEKHHIVVKGFWTDHQNPGKLVYLCQFNSIEEQKAAWRSFGSDPEWIKIKQVSEANGSLVTSMTSTLLDPVDYTPQP
ncbi:NIPSNAP family protein [Robertmurraya massiliosenegalensis]|uniref:NIPSNAP family protein n=1 Tax=Robertmurraya massiliosenegalensis TaxID=1287657 RepID=UPI0002E9B994|nr:NIPSNAP family protein [Robertmurraya massiliosenegalensis]